MNSPATKLKTNDFKAYLAKAIDYQQYKTNMLHALFQLQ